MLIVSNKNVARYQYKNNDEVDYIQEFKKPLFLNFIDSDYRSYADFAIYIGGIEDIFFVCYYKKKLYLMKWLKKWEKMKKWLRVWFK